MNCILISMMFQLRITIFPTQHKPLKRRLNITKKRRIESNASYPESFKCTRLFLVYFEKNFENKQKQPLKAVLRVEFFRKLFLLINVLKSFWSIFLRNLVQEIISSKFFG